jgi:arsenate reductase
MARPYSVLFVSSGNCVRSILAEASLNHWGRDRFRAFSAGSQPTGTVHPLALDVLRTNSLSIDGLRSKSWSEFEGPDGPSLDFVFMLCDKAANETCPAWPGHPVTAQWNIEEPAADEGAAERDRKGVQDAFRAVDARIRIFANLRLEALDRLSLQSHLDDRNLLADRAQTS